MVVACAAPSGALDVAASSILARMGASMQSENQSRAHRLSDPVAQIIASIRRYPVTIAISAIVAAVGFSTQDNSAAQMARLMARFGMTWPDLEDWRLWTMPVSTVMQSDSGFPWIILFFVLTSLFALETLAGSFAAAVTFLAADWISSPLTVVALKILSMLGNHEASSLLSIGSTGSSAAFHGAFAAGALLLPRKWSKRMILIMLAVVVFQFIFERLDNAIAHAIATFVGATLALSVWRPDVKQSAPGSSGANVDR
jgi:hypothetical protein